MANDYHNAGTEKQMPSSSVTEGKRKEKNEENFPRHLNP
jgi:hypothetical protein